MCLQELINLLKLEIPPNELNFYAFGLWNAREYEKAVKFANEFDICLELESTFGVIDTLIKSNYIELLDVFVDKHDALAEKAIQGLSTKIHYKEAAKLSEKHNICPDNFPVMLSQMKKSSLNFFMNKGDIGWYRLADIVCNDPELIGMMVKEFYSRYTNKRQNFLGNVVATLYDLYPQAVCQLTSAEIRGIESIPCSGYKLEDKFEPLDASHYISISLPISLVIFVDTEEKIEQMVWTGNLVGLDCE